MYYHLVERLNPQSPENAKKLYATPKLVGSVSAKVLAKQIATQTTLTAGDVSNVLKTFIDLLPMMMLLGKSVELEGVGTLRLSFSSKGVNTEGDFNTKLMRPVKVIFIPSSELKKRITDGITYEKMPKEK